MPPDSYWNIFVFMYGHLKVCLKFVSLQILFNAYKFTTILISFIYHFAVHLCSLYPLLSLSLFLSFRLFHHLSFQTAMVSSTKLNFVSGINTFPYFPYPPPPSIKRYILWIVLKYLLKSVNSITWLLAYSHVYTHMHIATRDYI